MSLKIASIAELIACSDPHRCEKGLGWCSARQPLPRRSAGVLELQAIRCSSLSYSPGDLSGGVLLSALLSDTGHGGGLMAPKHASGFQQAKVMQA